REYLIRRLANDVFEPGVCHALCRQEAFSKIQIPCGLLGQVSLGVLQGRWGRRQWHRGASMLFAASAAGEKQADS
ncbi:hypothetical protein, partial [Streptomyces sp. NRRL F-3273]|uniref:hypothetical protein n=1 Tax=Streptomyces sp. NRRL F-3273 TaxID=1463848 RepID=UPI00051664E7